MISKGVVGLGGRLAEVEKDEDVVAVAVGVVGEEEGGDGRGAGPIIGLLVRSVCWRGSQGC